MVKTSSKNVGATTLPGHGNTGHPNSSDPEKRGGRKSNRRKKSMKKKGKTAKKRKTKKARKTRRRKLAGAPGIGKTIYRAAHRGYYNEESEGKKAEDAKRRADALENIRNNKDYIEMKDMKDLEVGQTYSEFVGETTLKNLGKFQEEKQKGADNHDYGSNFDLIFDNGVLTGFNMGGRVFPPVTSLKGRVFKVNSGAIIGEDTRLPKEIAEKIGTYGGRKRKTRKTKKSRRARN